MGSSFYFFFTPLFSVLCPGLGAVRTSWPSGRGLGWWSSLLLRGTGVVFLSPRQSEEGSAPGSGADCPSGGSGAWIQEYRVQMGSVIVGTVSIFVCLHVGRVREYLFACMRVGTCACIYVCLFVYVHVSGQALDSASLIISGPPTTPCRWRMPPAAGALVVSRSGAGCSGERWPDLGGCLAGPGPPGFAGPRLGGGGPLDRRAQGRSALVWPAAGGTCGLAATPPWDVCIVAAG